MVYAPILIPTLCRDEHFIRCVESLKRNTWAKYTDVYVALDYPVSEKHWYGYKRIVEYLSNGKFDEFASFNVVKRPENYGAAKNMRTLRTEIFKRYDRFIRVDDDIEFAPTFLEYVDKCLEYYKDDSQVIAVSGYSYPLKWKVSVGSTVFKETFIAPMWGTGFWRDKYLKIEKEITQDLVIVNEFDKMVKDGLKKRVTDLCFSEILSGQSIKFKPGLSLISRISDISLRAYCGMFNYNVICPVLSKTRNHGFDGSGVCCQKVITRKNGKKSLNYPFSVQPIDCTTNEFIVVEDTQYANDNNRKLFNRFDRRGAKFKIKLESKLLLYRFLGKKNYLKLQKKFSHMRNKG